MSVPRLEQGSNPTDVEESGSGHGINSTGSENGLEACKSSSNSSAGSGSNSASAVASSATGEPLRSSEESGCFICRKNMRLDLILLCDGCDGEYHTFCVRPPLNKVPDNEWFCDKCKALGKGSSKSAPVSKYNGVYWTGSIKGGVRVELWTAKILRRSGRNPATIGTFSTEKEAAAAYDAEAIRVFGHDHPPLNLPDEIRKHDHDDSKQPAQPLQRPQLTAAVRSAQTAKTTQAAESLLASQAGQSAKSAQPTRDAQPEQQMQTTTGRKPAQPVPLVKGVQSTNVSQPSNPSLLTQVSKAAQPTMPAQPKMAQPAKQAQSVKVAQSTEAVQAAKVAQAIKLAQVAREAARAERTMKLAKTAKETAKISQPTKEVKVTQGSKLAQMAKAMQTTMVAQPGLLALDTELEPAARHARFAPATRSMPVAHPPQLVQLSRTVNTTQPQQLGQLQQVDQSQQHEWRVESGDKGGMEQSREKGDDDDVHAKDAAWVDIGAFGGQGTSTKRNTLGSSAKGSSAGVFDTTRKVNNGDLGNGLTSNLVVGRDIGGACSSSEAISDSKVGGTGVATFLKSNTRADVGTAQTTVTVSSPPSARVSLPQTPGVIDDSSADAASKSRPGGAGADYSIDSSDDSSGNQSLSRVAGERSQVSVGSSGDEEIVRENVSNPYSTRLNSNGNMDPDHPTGRKRVKTKWLQEYELGKADASKRPSSTASGAPSTPAALATQAAPSVIPAGEKRNVALSGQEIGRNRSVSCSDACVASEGGARTSGMKLVSKWKGKGKAKTKSDGANVPWGSKDWCGHAASLEGLQQIKDGVKVWFESEDGTIVGEDGNHFFCSACGEHGEVTCCDGCPRVFHEECLELGSDSQLAAEHQTEDDAWYCPACVSVGKINLVRGEEPIWSQETREQSGRHKTAMESSYTNRQTPKGTKREPSPPQSTTKRSPRRSSRARVVSRAATPDPVPGSEAETDPENTVNIGDAADQPKRVSRVKVFSPELDNSLLRSLLYDEKYTHVVPRYMSNRKAKVGHGKPPDPKKTPGWGPDEEELENKGDDEENKERENRFRTTGTHRGDASLVNAKTVRSTAKPDAPLGALTEHPPLSRKAGRRPMQPEHSDGTRIGPAFGASSGPSGILDGTAVAFGARAMGPFRSGLAATIVDVGLVPKEKAVEAGYIEIVAAEETADKDARGKAAAGCSHGTETETTAFGSAKVEWTARVPSEVWRRIQGAKQIKLEGEGAVGGENAAVKQPSAPLAERDARQDLSQTSGPDGRLRQSDVPMIFADQGSVASGAGAGKASARTCDYMHADHDDPGNMFGYPGAETVPSGSRNVSACTGRYSSRESYAPRNRRRGDQSRSVLRRANERDRAKRKEYRRWNLKHIRVMGDDVGKAEACSLCRLRPTDALMVCTSNDLAKIHSFCFPCLETKEGVEKEKITTGVIKWDCPTCRERRERPQRRAQPPAALRGTNWIGGLVGAGHSNLAHKASKGRKRSRSKDSDRGPSGAGVRSRDADREANAVVSKGLKRSLSSNELQGATRGTNGRKSPLVGTCSSSWQKNEGRGGGGSRQNKSPRGDVDGSIIAAANGTDSSIEGSDRDKITGGEGVGDGNIVGEEQEPAAPDGLEHRRLLRIAATMALDRLQELDPLDLFKNPVPDGVDGYTEAIPYPIDFSTIRRRMQWGLYKSLPDLALDVQLLCANAMTFNPPGTAYYAAATNVQEGAERLWPNAQDLLDSLLSAEKVAAKHHRRGPAAATAAWPLDGPFIGFELTPANEDAYYMHVAIRRVAAAVRARADYEEGLLKVDRARAHTAATAEEAQGDATASVDKEEKALAANEEKLAKELEKTAAVAASSAAMLYTCGEILEEESLLRDSLSALRAENKMDALRHEQECARCVPIDPVTLREREEATRCMPTPVIRREVAPDGEFLNVDPAKSQPGPVGPNPILEERADPNPPTSVVPEWRVLKAALDSKQRSGVDAASNARAFRKFFSNVGDLNRTRLRVGRSAIQGEGVFANKDICAHELVAEFIGERVTVEEAKRRLAEYRQAKVSDSFVRLSDKKFIDATQKGNVARFLNHSCAPNCYLRTVAAGKEDSEEERVCIFSLKDIYKDEEITYSYPAPYKVGMGGVVARDCACRAPGCRGRMSSREQL